MGDTSERSEAALPPRCRCGFWGSSKTLNLCSKCFADVQKKQPEDDCAPPPIQAPQQPVSDPAGVLQPERRGSSSDTARDPPRPTKRPTEAGTLSASSCSRAARRQGNGRGGGPEEEAPTQKNRRRCFLCQSKLELVQQELGCCRCGFIFCMRHRLPEQHHCRFDHLGRGRHDAVLKMVKLERKVGRACQRIGEGCS